MIVLATAALILSSVMIAAWWWQRRTANASWVDAFWTFGLGFAGAVAALSAGREPRGALAAAVVAVWAVRLGTYIAARSRRGHEDMRYAQFRRDWGAAFQRRMFWFLQIQALAATILVLPIYAAARSPRAFGALDLVALIIVTVAIAGEAAADRQLHGFRSNPANRGKICDTGLWELSRHPNYFFEWLFWCAWPVFAIGSTWFWVALAGPTIMYWLLVHVSGIPPLEAQMLKSRGDAWIVYQRRVRAFFPIPKGGSI